MKPSAPPTSMELARIVWASHILSYMNPHTGAIPPDKHHAHGAVSEAESDEDTDLDDDADAELETATQNADFLTPSDENIREKYLNCIAELFSHSKGGATVTAAALREKEDSIEVDLSRNGGFQAGDESYLAFLTAFLATAGDGEERTKERQDFDSFLGTTIDYNANRLDFWIQKAVSLVQRTPIRLLAPGSPTSGLETRYCNAEKTTAPSAVQRLLLKTSLWHLRQSDPSQICIERREIVVLSDLAISSSESTLSYVRSLMPSIDSSKLLFWWRCLARPVTILRTLAAITKLLPAFRAVSFISLEAPRPVKLRTDQTPQIPKAWRILSLPSGIPASVTRRARNFRADCSRKLTVHCEMQLLTRYEADPSLTPTLAYFGCSKKACFLCAAFLALSPLKPRVRGKHGTCHTNWAVLTELTGVDGRLTQLCDIIKEQIMLLMEPSPRAAAQAVHQSSAVSELKTADMVHLRQRVAHREAAEKVAKEERERLRTLLDPGSVGPQNIYCNDLRTLCAMCQWPGTRCTGCFGITYCSKRCQSIDWPAHKLLCRKVIPYLESRPTEHCRIGIWFPRDENKPRLVWVAFRQCPRDGTIFPIFDHFLQVPPDSLPLLWTLPFKTNNRRQINLGYQITIHYQDYAEIINKSLHRSIEACHGMTAPTTMYGHYVVLCGPPHRSAAEHGDMTPADFRHTLDFFSTYFDDTVRDMPSSNTVRVLKINSPFEQRLYGRETFTTVWVDRNFVSTSNVSELARVILGYDIRVCQVKAAEMERQGEGDDEESEWDNPYVKVLMSKGIDTCGKWWWGGEHNGGGYAKGSAILMRDDRQDLDTKTVEMMCTYCVDVLQPLFEKSEGKISRLKVLEAISGETLRAWMKTQEN